MLNIIIFDIHLSIYPIYQQACECLMKKWTMLAADCWLHGQVILHQHFLDHEQASYTKHV